MTETDDTFPEILPEFDRTRWAGLTAGQRKKARARLLAFQAWAAGEIGVDAAANASGISTSRFYRLAALWRASPSLAALGAFTGGGAARQRLDPLAIERLQSAVPRVVAMNAGASVSSLVRLLVEQADVPESQLPGVIRLRTIVEEELRRVDALGEAGNAVRLDCTAVNLPRADGRPFIMFACVDVGTRLILGAAISEEPMSEGYAAVAADAARRIRLFRSALPWALRLARVEMTSGVDEDASWALLDRIKSGGVRAHVQLARRPNRFGAYFRAAIGPRIGRIAITPGRTVKGSAMPDNNDMSAWTHSEAKAALMAAVDVYNENIRVDLPAAHGRPPDDLRLMIDLLANKRNRTRSRP